MSRWSRSAVVAVTSLAAIALAGCGPERTTSAAPEQPNVLSLLASDVKGSLQKTMDNTTRTSTVSVVMDGKMAGETVNARGALVVGRPFKAELTMQDPTGGPITVRIIDTAFYVELPQKQRAEMGGKRWMKMDLSVAGQQAASAFADQLDDMDPVQQVKTLLAAESVTVVGREDIDGVPTVHYTVTVPVATYLDKVDAKMRPTVEQQLTKQGIKEVKTDLWVDEKYQPRKVRTVMGASGDLTMRYTDYGKPVTVEVPPATETVDFAQMMKDLAAG